MKQITITISDEASKRLDEHAAENGKSAADFLAWRMEQDYADDWYDRLDDDAKAAIAEGEAQAGRGEFATDEDVQAAFRAFRE